MHNYFLRLVDQLGIILRETGFNYTLWIVKNRIVFGSVDCMLLTSFQIISFYIYLYIYVCVCVKVYESNKIKTTSGGPSTRATRAMALVLALNYSGQNTIFSISKHK